METSADGDQATCLWRPRDPYGWREGIVVSGSADLLETVEATRHADADHPAAPHTPRLPVEQIIER